MCNLSHQKYIFSKFSPQNGENDSHIFAYINICSIISMYNLVLYSSFVAYTFFFTFHILILNLFLHLVFQKKNMKLPKLMTIVVGFLPSTSSPCPSSFFFILILFHHLVAYRVFFLCIVYASSRCKYISVHCVCDMIGPFWYYLYPWATAALTNHPKLTDLK